MESSHKNVLVTILVSQPGAKDFFTEHLDGFRTEDMPFAIIVHLQE